MSEEEWESVEETELNLWALAGMTVSTLVDDPDYRIIDENTIEVRGADGFSTYHRSNGRQANTLVDERRPPKRPGK